MPLWLSSKNCGRGTEGDIGVRYMYMSMDVLVTVPSADTRT